MRYVKFFKTDDNSTGLFNEELNEIYHSKTGALKESFDKFIFPINLDYYKEKYDTINVMDICYGIGYNSKALLSVMENYNIHIDALEYDKKLAYISPFISDCIENNNLKIIIIENLLNMGIDIRDIFSTLNQFLSQNKHEFFNTFICRFIAKYFNEILQLQSDNNKRLNLHNIYYNYISDNNNKSLKTNKYNNVSINWFFNDARNVIRTLNKEYNIVFLDAFSSQKDPTLWTFDFLSEISKRISKDGIILSYSKSSPFRNSLLNLGFFVGKTFISDIDMGTVASFDKSNIKYPLSDYDINLLNTRSGIFYRDENFIDTPEHILSRRKIEQDSSNKISHTAFLKSHNNL